MANRQPDAELIRMLLDRLERIPADSAWAHRASGVRGTLIRILEEMETGGPVDSAALENSTLIGFQILREVARQRLQNQSRFQESHKP